MYSLYEIRTHTGNVVWWDPSWRPTQPDFDYAYRMAWDNGNPIRLKLFRLGQEVANVEWDEDQQKFIENKY